MTKFVELLNRMISLCRDCFLRYYFKTADICGKPEFAEFCGLLNQTGIENILSSGLYTIFAPTNEALQNATARLNGTVDFSDTKIVTDIVLQHIVQGSAIFARDIVCNSIVEMANGAKIDFLCPSADVINIAGPVYDPLSDPLLSITETDMVGCHVIIHMIDGVILPKLKYVRSHVDYILEYQR